MKRTMKSILILAGIYSFNISVLAESNPNQFIDSRAQAMVEVIGTNQNLYLSNPELFKAKINEIFEPMVDFRRVGASVMGKKFYLAATKDQGIKYYAIVLYAMLIPLMQNETEGDDLDTT